MELDRTLGLRVLERAVRNAGSLERVARRLGVTPGALEVFLEGKRVIPESLFMQLVDLAMEDGGAASPLQGPSLSRE